MLVEVGDDAADRGLDDSLVVDAIDVLAPHAVDDFGDERRGFDRRIERGRRGFGSPRERCPDCAAECQPKPEHDAGEQHDYAAESQGHLLLLALPVRPAATLAQGLPPRNRPTLCHSAARQRARRARSTGAD